MIRLSKYSFLFSVSVLYIALKSCLVCKPGVAYKKVAYKKKQVFTNSTRDTEERRHAQIYMAQVDLKNCKLCIYIIFPLTKFSLRKIVIFIAISKLFINVSLLALQ